MNDEKVHGKPGIKILIVKIRGHSRKQKWDMKRNFLQSFTFTFFG